MPCVWLPGYSEPMEQRDYWLSKLFFDLQTPALAAEYLDDRDRILDCYPLKPEVRRAILEDDVAYLYPLVNPYLLRFYFFVAGMTDQVFIERLRNLGKIDPRRANRG